jgi:hypothetical protein
MDSSGNGQKCQGGSGGNFGLPPSLQPQTSMRDTRLLARAVKQRFPMGDHIRELLPEAFAEIFFDTDLNLGHRIAAGKALIDADKVNLEDEKRADPHTVNVNLNGRLAVRPEELTDEQLIDAVLERRDRLAGVRASVSPPGDPPSGNGAHQP